MTFLAVCRTATERNTALAQCTDEWIAYRDPDVVAAAD
jgi:hypothetical protein